jgi:hypothetical protein
MNLKYVTYLYPALWGKNWIGEGEGDGGTETVKSLRGKCMPPSLLLIQLCDNK